MTIFFFALFSGFCGKDAGAAAYGEKIRFARDAPVRFSDLTLIYTGETQVSNEKFPPGFTYQNFKVQNGSEEKQVAWSSGAGEIGPSAFEFGGAKYELELRRSETLGKLADDELVLRRR